MSGAEGHKRQRAVMATDSDWQTVRGVMPDYG